ncbi:Aste57867_8218 [Aphanomyces stellatus]|uniref:Aste57867_8218 protein n=1 Tax=Aphanomyces stellatus TaxID=120398 RepID=A0A485KJQ7_9STRA|nr:hypothetical protein As57867_008187 [Aphanomyces stellatus]VFT85105.1 Aste57867_8218 [Aphanomyces stellatus]
MSGIKQFALDAFCLRQFDDPNYKGTQVKYDKAAFESKINQLYNDKACVLVDGYNLYLPLLPSTENQPPCSYAPFCKHLFVPNFVDARLSSAAITDANAHLLKSDYVARVPTELPVLVRWFPVDKVTPGVAQYLDIILYSRAQIEQETRATGAAADIANADIPWGIISVKAQDVPHELPMNPITMMRNALGKEEGGSGVPLQREPYLASVAYWSKNAVIQ